MSTPDLDLTTRAALDKVLDKGAHRFLTDAEFDALAALRDACPPPRWLPTGDGMAVRTDEAGDQSVYYVRDGKVGAYLRFDGTLRFSFDPAEFPGIWEPYVHEVTTEQIIKAALDADCRMYTVRAVLPALGCREATP